MSLSTSYFKYKIQSTQTIHNSQVKRTVRPQPVSLKLGTLAQVRGVPSLKLQALA